MTEEQLRALAPQIIAAKALSISTAEVREIGHDLLDGVEISRADANRLYYLIVTSRISASWPDGLAPSAEAVAQLTAAVS